MTEFENIIGYENLYKINRQGEIWSCLYQKVMKPQITDDGYMFVDLKKDGIRHKGRIHRLLGLQYIPNPDNSPTIDHIDRNKSNNSLENLRWATKKEQANNKTTNIVLLTEEQQAERIDNIKEYKANWARWNRLKSGDVPLIPVPALRQDEINEARRYENLTPEQIEKKKEQNKKSYAKITEDNKIAARERAKKQREDIKADPEKLALAREYKRLKAIEYRKKNKDVYIYANCSAKVAEPELLSGV